MDGDFGARKEQAPQGIPELAGLDSLDRPGRGSLPSLSQQARRKELRSARWILIVVGLLIAGAHVLLFSTADKAVDEQFEKELSTIHAQGMQVDPDVVEQLKADAVRSVKVVTAGMACVGALLCVLGVAVYKFPLLSTATGLIIYLGVVALNAFFDPTTIAQGLLIKGIVIVGLVQAVRAALAYERDLKEGSSPVTTA